MPADLDTLTLLVETGEQFDLWTEATIETRSSTRARP